MRVSILVASIATALTLAACGDDGGSDTDANSDGDDYIAQTEAICVSSAEQVRDVNLEAGVDETMEDTAKRFEDTLAVREDVLEEIQGVDAPADDTDFADYVTASEEYVEAYAEQTDAFASGDEAKIAKAGDAVSKAGEEREAAAKAAGMDACAGILPEDQAAAAEEVVRQFDTTADPATSCDVDSPDSLVTEQLLESPVLGGSVEKCEQIQKQIEGNLATDIKVTNTEGVEDVVATIEFEDVGGKFDGEASRATLYYLDGGWRIYTIGAAG
jgi:hypothetical protein